MQPVTDMPKFSTNYAQHIYTNPSCNPLATNWFSCDWGPLWADGLVHTHSLNGDVCAKFGVLVLISHIQVKGLISLTLCGRGTS